MIKLPKSSTIHIQGPRPRNLSITRDDHGVPHIQADTADDLNWGLGYCMATDRGMQLQLMRILGQGRVCELLEDTADNLKLDLFFRRMAWRRDINKVIAELTPATLSWCQALCDGINAGLQARKVSLMRVLAGQPEPWTIADIVLMLKMTSYLSLAQTQAESERLFIELVQAGMSDEKLESLFPIKDQSFDRELIEKIALPERLIPLELTWQTAIPRMIASNNWVISGERTESGATMMANDPHMEVNRLPNVWYEAVLKSPEYTGMGYTLPGVPGLLIGRTHDIAYGATYSFADTVDSWVHECKNGKYKRGKSWRKFEMRQEHIIRKHHTDHIEQFYENAHGVLEGNPHQDGFYLCTSWTSTGSGATSLNAARAMIDVKDADGARNQLGKIEGAFCWVISDRENNIAYQMSGLCPKRKDKWNGFTPGLGWDSDYDWQGIHKVEDLPRALNPEKGFIVTANQDLNALGIASPINMPMCDHRARRIEQLLKDDDKHSIAKARDIQMDTYSLQAEEFMAVLKPVLNKHFKHCVLADVLIQWDLHYDKHSTGAALFEEFYAELRQIVFQDDQIKPELTKHLREQTCLFVDFYQNFDRCLLDKHSIWFDEQDQEQTFIQAFTLAKNKFVSETWGERNNFKFTNLLFKGKLPDFLGIDSIELPMIGGRATPHQGQLYTSFGRQTSFAAAVRIVADMNESVLHSRTAGGVSDNPLSPWYVSEVQGWLDGTYKRTEL